MDVEKEKRAYALLERDLLALAKKYVDIFPEYEMQEHCPVESCKIMWPHIIKGAKYCHLHGKEFKKGKSRLSVAQVMADISSVARSLGDGLDDA